MAKSDLVVLSYEDRETLEQMRDHHPKAYLREEAAGLLKIAEGHSGRWVAREGLHKPRQPDTVYGGANNYRKEGLAGLYVKPGRGRKPALAAPYAEDPKKAREALHHVIGRDPRQLGEERTRWTLASLQRASGILQQRTPSGVWKALKRLGVSYKRARDYVHSPDPQYAEKLTHISFQIRRAREAPEVIVVLFQDELTYYRQPSLAQAYAPCGREQAHAQRSHRSNTRRRVVATLDAFSGRVIAHQASRIGIKALVDFYEQVAAGYPAADLIYIIQDNWPVHFHPDVLAALQPQHSPFPIYRPSNWPDQPSAKARALDLPIQLLPLPTYASWANPIEKLWRWLKQDVLHLHRFSDRWRDLWKKVDGFLNQFQHGSEELLRYVGLTNPLNLYGPALFSQGRPPPLPV